MEVFADVVVPESVGCSHGDTYGRRRHRSAILESIRTLSKVMPRQASGLAGSQHVDARESRSTGYGLGGSRGGTRSWVLARACEALQLIEGIL